MRAGRNFFVGGGGGSEVHQGRACKGVSEWGVPGQELPQDAGEVNKNFVKNQ